MSTITLNYFLFLLSLLVLITIRLIIDLLFDIGRSPRGFCLFSLFAFPSRVIAVTSSQIWNLSGTCNYMFIPCGLAPSAWKCDIYISLFNNYFCALSNSICNITLSWMMYHSVVLEWCFKYNKCDILYFIIQWFFLCTFKSCLLI